MLLTLYQSMKKTIKDWLIVLASLADDAAVALLALLILRLLKIQISRWIILALILLFVASIFIMHRLVIPAFHRKPTTGQEGMVGLEGKVIQPLTPDGLVKVKGEYWKASSIDGDIEVGEHVEIVGLDGLVLRVRRKSQYPRQSKSNWFLHP